MQEMIPHFTVEFFFFFWMRGGFLFFSGGGWSFVLFLFFVFLQYFSLHPFCRVIPLGPDVFASL